MEHVPYLFLSIKEIFFNPRKARLFVIQPTNICYCRKKLTEPDVKNCLFKKYEMKKNSAKHEQFSMGCQHRTLKGIMKGGCGGAGGKGREIQGMQYTGGFLVLQKMLSTSSLDIPSFQGDPTIFYNGIFLKQTPHIKN